MERATVGDDEDARLAENQRTIWDAAKLAQCVRIGGAGISGD